jgi:drug/metabolite transporter (DMT)-like permease
MCLLWGVLMPPVYAMLRDWRSLIRSPRETGVAAAGGGVSLLAYGIIIFAMSLGPMGPVSALRETSVIFAALIGRIFLHERLTTYRIAACVIVAIGALCIGHAGRSQSLRHVTAGASGIKNGL